MKILLFLYPQSKYDLSVANLMTKMKLFLHVMGLYCWKELFGKQIFPRTVEWEALQSSSRASSAGLWQKQNPRLGGSGDFPSTVNRVPI